jgi:hypothetical protein
LASSYLMSATTTPHHKVNAGPIISGPLLLLETTSTCT